MSESIFSKSIFKDHGLGIGLRPIRIDLTRPIDPEVTEVHDLSFIVTDLSQVPQTGPALFVAAVPAQIGLAQGASTTVAVEVTGVRGVPAGTLVKLSLENLPKGVQASFFDVVIALNPSGPGMVMGTGKLTLTAAPDAPVGDTDVSVMASGGGLSDQSVAIIGVLLPAVQ